MGEHQPFFCFMNIIIRRAISLVVLWLVVGRSYTNLRGVLLTGALKISDRLLNR